MRIIDTIMSSILGRAPPPTSAGTTPAAPQRSEAPVATPTPTRGSATTVAPTPANVQHSGPGPIPTPTPREQQSAPSRPEGAPAKTVAPAEPGRPEAEPAAHAETPAAKTPPSAATASRPVDVAAVLDARAEETDEELNWRTSIVDLMKLLKLDSSIAARTALAKELKYTGDTKDSAAMNVWLHKQVMAKLVEGGGRLPSEVLH
jgi:hypothetical protein